MGNSTLSLYWYPCDCQSCQSLQAPHFPGILHSIQSQHRSEGEVSKIGREFLSYNVLLRSFWGPRNTFIITICVSSVISIRQWDAENEAAMILTDNVNVRQSQPQKLRHKRRISQPSLSVLIVLQDLNHVLNTLPLLRQPALSTDNWGVS